MRLFSRTLLTLAGNATSFGAPIMIVNATGILVTNATLLTAGELPSLQKTLAYLWIVFLCILLGCIIVTTVLGELFSEICFNINSKVMKKYEKLVLQKILRRG